MLNFFKKIKENITTLIEKSKMGKTLTQKEQYELTLYFLEQKDPQNAIRHLCFTLSIEEVPENTLDIMDSIIDIYQLDTLTFFENQNIDYIGFLILKIYMLKQLNQSITGIYLLTEMIHKTKNDMPYVQWLIDMFLKIDSQNEIEERKLYSILINISKYFQETSSEKINEIQKKLLDVSSTFLKEYLLIHENHLSNTDIFSISALIMRRVFQKKEAFTYALKGYKKTKTIFSTIAMGIIYKEMNYLLESTNYYKEAIEIDPLNIGCLLDLAELYIQLEQYDEAIPLYEKILELDPNNSFALPAYY